MDLYSVIKALEDRRLKVVAERIGVSYQTLLRISNGDTKRPQYAVMMKLVEYLENGVTNK